MGITFDFFNTLIEPKDIYVSERALNSVYDVGVKHGLTIDFGEFLNKASSHWEKVLKKRIEEGTETLYSIHLLEIFEDAGIQPSEASTVIKESTDTYFEILTAGTRLVKGAFEVIENLSKKYKIGLISNFTYPPFIHTQLEQYNLSDFFEVVTISGDHGFTKPFPRIFTHTADLMDMKPREIIHIGDSLECDIVGAKKAGLKAIWFKRNDEQKMKDYNKQQSECEFLPDLTIHQLSELLEANLDSLISNQSDL